MRLKTAMKIFVPAVGLIILFLLLSGMPRKYFKQKSSLDLKSSMGGIEKNDFMPILAKIEEDVQKEIDKKDVKDIALYYEDLNSGDWIGINKDEKFNLASLVKVPLMMECLESVESHPGLLKKRLLFTGDKDWTSQQNIKPMKSLELGKSYSLEEIMFRMIAYSDNNSMSMLLDEFPADRLDHYLTEHKIDYEEAPDGFKMSLGTYSWFFENLYYKSLHNDTMARKALSYLAAEDFPQGMHAAVPASIVVESKFGEKILKDENGNVKSVQLHEVGIVLDGNHPFLLGIMTSGKDLTKLEKVIQNITKDIYEEIEHAANHLPNKMNCMHAQCHA